MADDQQTPSDALLRLAAAYDITPDYWGFDGQHKIASAATLQGVLKALGVDASSPERIELALAHREDQPWRRTLPPVVVVREGRQAHVPVHVTHEDPVEVWLELDPEAGGGRREVTQADVPVPPRSVDGRLVGRATFTLPADLPLGWHEIHAEGPSARARSTVIVTPDRLELPDTLDAGRAWGFMAQLYSVRSRRSWGVGDLVDLADLGAMTARRGADFLLINPLHAAEPQVPLTPSPYLPTTRRFVNPLYIRVEEVPEAAYLSAADRTLVEWAGEQAIALDTDPGPIDRDAAWTAKRAALEVIFAFERSAARQASFDAFVEEQGPGLDTFALWCALAEKHGPDLRTWPAELLDPGSDAVAAAGTELAERVTFHRWLQWVADEQLADAHRAALDNGMTIGIMHDLAVGVHPQGADVWSLGEVLARGASVGAPPDMYNQQGQNWSQPPWQPDALARSAYRPYRDMLRTVLRHAGAIRIDHVLGLFRLWWVPEGSATPSEGAYVRYDHEALVGILALEAYRAGAIVIGEDLGVVEPWVRDYLSERGVLGTSVLWFERDMNGDPLAPEDYRELVLATVTTHDLPPTAGYLAGEHVAIRERLGLLTEPVATVRAAAAAERDRMLAALRARDLLGDDPSEREIVEAMHRYVLATPSVLVGVSLADAVGERRAQNQPGTDQEYPNWKVPLADSAGQVVLVDDLFTNARLHSLAQVLNEGRWSLTP
ncbi:4-alpha-glucanotransferase [Cellulomonas fimi]|uniref:4-alpha-glucanotransferase n=1 Tax=Cellulomonas fimi TaxID=1708 RepID=UPI00234CAA33|nr:4-alpha-glucanotransferase [Cellulomonas fimi]MDC7122172.1 4-alpha-glucanotransferase [Cellulomonas fimi]